MYVVRHEYSVVLPTKPDGIFAVADKVIKWFMGCGTYQLVIEK